jgi:hypothetical protein
VSVVVGYCCCKGKERVPREVWEERQVGRRVYWMLVEEFGLVPRCSYCVVVKVKLLWATGGGIAEFVAFPCPSSELIFLFSLGVWMTHEVRLVFFFSEFL